MRTAAFAAFLAAAASAGAQTAPQPEPAGPPSTAPAPPVTTPLPGPASDPMAPPAPAAPATPPTATAPDASAPDPVAATIEADWGKYDKDAGNSLSRTEFDGWVKALQAEAGKKAPTRGQLSAAFRQADGDRDGAVSKEELATYLRG